MKQKRVVITGMGCISPFGKGIASLFQGLEKGVNATKIMPGWDQYKGLQSQVGVPVPEMDNRDIPRQQRRSMGRLSIFAAKAAAEAVAQSGLAEEVVQADRTGCIFGSTMGSAGSINESFEIMLPNLDLGLLSSTKFFQCVSHTAAMNVSQYLGIRGVVLSTAAACASGLQAVGAAADLIRSGRQDVVVCGGAEELHPTVTGSFDILFATSTQYNDNPSGTPRPFDRDRDGLVCAEGAGALVLEEFDHAQARNAQIYGEIVGYHTCGNGAHISQSDSSSMVRCMKAALDEAEACPGDIGYINAHATATLQGDKAEAEAIHALFGDRVPVSSLKGHLGHTLGASGAIELIATIHMIRAGYLYPTHNLQNVADDCAGIQHVVEKQSVSTDLFLKNSFAFGGINAALVCRTL